MADAAVLDASKARAAAENALKVRERVHVMFTILGCGAGLHIIDDFDCIVLFLPDCLPLDWLMRATRVWGQLCREHAHLLLRLQTRFYNCTQTWYATC